MLGFLVGFLGSFLGLLIYFLGLVLDLLPCAGGLRVVVVVGIFGVVGRFIIFGILGIIRIIGVLGEVGAFGVVGTFGTLATLSCGFWSGFFDNGFWFLGVYDERAADTELEGRYRIDIKPNGGCLPNIEGEESLYVVVVGYDAGLPVALYVVIGIEEFDRESWFKPSIVVAHLESFHPGLGQSFGDTLELDLYVVVRDLVFSIDNFEERMQRSRHLNLVGCNLEDSGFVGETVVVVIGPFDFCSSGFLLGCQGDVDADGDKQDCGNGWLEPLRSEYGIPIDIHLKFIFSKASTF